MGNGARQCAPRGRGVGPSGSPRSARVGFGAEPRLMKMSDLNCNSVEGAVKVVSGTARSMGIEIEG